MERLRVLGEIPVRHFNKDRGKFSSQPLDPDGNPDTSFLAKIPADQSFRSRPSTRTACSLTWREWHQLRAGEVRNNCGGCHAHSQQPTPFGKRAPLARTTRSLISPKNTLITLRKQ